MDLKCKFKVIFNPEIENYEKIKEEIERNNKMKHKKKVFFSVLGFLSLVVFLITESLFFQQDLKFDFKVVCAVISFILAIVFLVRMAIYSEADVISEQLKLSKILENTSILTICTQNNDYVSSIVYEDSDYFVKELKC